MQLGLHVGPVTTGVGDISWLCCLPVVPAPLTGIPCLDSEGEHTSLIFQRPAVAESGKLREAPPSQKRRRGEWVRGEEGAGLQPGCKENK